MTIELVHVSKAYGSRQVLSSLDFTLEEGVTCITGPSGRGKTTLLRLILGLEKPDSGLIRADSCRWAAVFQEDRLLEQLDARGNLKFVLGKAYDEAAAQALLGQLGMTDLEGKPVRDYSGGMKRRLALARALLAPSDAIALDEPFTGLDEENRVRALACIRKAAQEKPVLLITHEPKDAEALEARSFPL